MDVAGRKRRGRALLLGLVTVLVAVVASLGVWVLRGAERSALEPVGQGGVTALPRAGALPRGEADGEASTDRRLGEGTRVALKPAIDPAMASHPPRIWRGRVQDRATGDPLEGAVVAVRDVGLPLEAEARSDAAGEFSLVWHGPDLPDARALHEGFVSLHRPRVDLGAPALLELDRFAVIVGRVIGPSAEDLAEGRVSLWNLATDRGARREPLERALDEEGCFEFRDLFPAEFVVAVSVPGWSLDVESALLLEPGERVELLLEPVLGATLFGRVLTEPGGAPVEGARVSLQPERQGVSGAVEGVGGLETDTLAGGTFMLRGLSAGSNTFTVETAWGGHATRQVAVADAGERIGPLEVRVAAPASLAGRVVDESGSGVCGARVRAAWKGSALASEPSTGADGFGGVLGVDADANGRFRFEVLPAGRPLELLAFREDDEAPADPVLAERLGFAPSLRLATGERREGLELRVWRPLARRGVVRDPAGRPIGGVRVQAWHTDHRVREEVLTESEGEFELHGLVPGTYNVYLRHREFLPGSERIAVTPGVDLPLTFLLEPAHRITGWVVDEQGNAVPFARVAAQPAFEERERRRRGESLGAGCDDYGRFELGPLAAGEWRLRGGASGHETATIEPVAVPGAEGLELVLRRRAPLERATVTGQAVCSDGCSPRSLRVDDLRGGVLQQEGSRFRLDGVRPGRARFTFSAAGCAPVRLDPLDLAPGARMDLGVIELPLAVEVSVFVRAEAGELTPDRLSIRLRPLPPEEGGYGSRTISLTARSMKRSRAGDGAPRQGLGGYSSEVPVGRWRLVVDHPGFERHQETITLGAERRRRQLEVELSPVKAKARAKKEKKGGKKDSR